MPGTVSKSSSTCAAMKLASASAFTCDDALIVNFFDILLTGRLFCEELRAPMYML